MYASGIPMGIITDKRGPRPAAIIGMVTLLVGYYPIKLGRMKHFQLCDGADCWQHTIRVREA